MEEIIKSPINIIQYDYKDFIIIKYLTNSLPGVIYKDNSIYKLIKFIKNENSKLIICEQTIENFLYNKNYLKFEYSKYLERIRLLKFLFNECIFFNKSVLFFVNRNFDKQLMNHSYNYFYLKNKKLKIIKSRYINPEKILDISDYIKPYERKIKLKNI